MNTQQINVLTQVLDAGLKTIGSQTGVQSQMSGEAATITDAVKAFGLYAQSVAETEAEAEAAQAEKPKAA